MSRKMTLLILGGTKFLGRHLVHAALDRGHRVTLFNRGQTNPDLFPELEKLRGNRDGDLRALKGRRWDAVIDTCGLASEKVRAAAKLLADSIAHYTFVSSISVYRDFTKPGLDESAMAEQLPAGAIEDEKNSDTYGARKALCEQAVEETMPGRVLNVRAGLIVGPHDESGRFLYWVRRTALGGEMLAPGDPNAPVQLIDARDLAGWIIRMVESGTVGVYNATGPASLLTFHQMLEHCKTASGREPRTTWIDDQFLLENGVAPFSELPFWLPLKPHKGFFAIDCRRAFASGLDCRRLFETARDTLAWDRAAGGQGQIGLMLDREKELLQTWRNKCSNFEIKPKAAS
jgi:2'-hydroxyisoflavone reductase